ncbi:hypothetical protein H2204_012292 [Knufia peltigerae]|uniref:Transcription factor domain-containing protein n=1 Tax=Knufia peltigerae TaxID=1002370 RepID=A0AA38XSS2_9EURO|nr:hypothetical protein H2204_012292 [Knufia peltigerae]
MESFPTQGPPPIDIATEALEDFETVIADDERLRPSDPYFSPLIAGQHEDISPLVDLQSELQEVDYSQALCLFDIGSEFLNGLGFDPGDPTSFDILFDETMLTNSYGSDIQTDTAYERLNQAVFARDTPSQDQRERLDSWIKRPLIPRQYDIEVIDVLIRIFFRHVDKVFSSFTDYEVSVHTLPAQVLAMAAVGALFSNSAGSEIIAKLYYTDSQRMLTYLILDDCSINTLERSASLLQTYIALEIFGLCSGHQRSDEISEASHSGLVQAMADHQTLLDNTDLLLDSASEGIIVINDILIIECYRTLLLQLQPSFARPHLQLVQTLLGRLEHSDPQNLLDTASVTTFYQELSCIGSISWFAMSHPTGNCSSPMGQCWRPETIEMYSQRLLESKPTEFTEMPSARTLLFTIVMALHTPLEHFQDIAHTIVAREGASRSATPVELGDLHARVLDQWTHSGHYDLALSHAGQILGAGEEIVASQRARRRFEATHDAVCVFLATLVFAIAKLGTENDSEAKVKLSGQVKIGIVLLESFQVRISTVFKSILVLLDNESWHGES